MAFVLEKILKEDVPFFNSLGIKNWTGDHPKIIIPGRTTWCIDREKKAFLMCLGGGRDDEPYISVFWWDGLEIRIEEKSDEKKTPDGKSIRRIFKLSTAKESYNKQNEITQLIIEALTAIQEQDEISLGKKINNEYVVSDNTITEIILNMEA
jgi:hypothetical protein